MDIHAVGFDIDGTLYPDYRAHFRSFGFFLAHARTILAFSRTRRAMRRRHEEAFQAADPDEAEARVFAEYLGRPVDEAREIRDRVLYRRWEKHFRKVRPYAGVAEALGRLKDAGIKLAALSDFPVGRKLEYFGVEEHFDVVLGYPESLRLKPRPEPFVLMAERLGEEPENILYVGNKLDYDVMGAENAGMRGALIGPPGRRAPSGVRAFTDYRQLADSILTEVTT